MAVPLQGSGTFALEAMLTTLVGPTDRVLILTNGAYGRRLVQMAECLGVSIDTVDCPENATHSPDVVRRKLKESAYSHLAVVHCETTTGILNPIHRWGQLARDANCTFLVDAMSSFGGIPTDWESTGVDCFVSSSNKCLQGVPGFAFAVVKRTLLTQIDHVPPSLSLNLRQQWEGLEATGQFRFTPPTHTLLAFRQALKELEQEGGVCRTGSTLPSKS